MNNKNSENHNTYRIPYILTGLMFGILFAACMIIFNFVIFEVAGIVLNVVRMITYFMALLIIFSISVRFSVINEIKNPDNFIPRRNTFYYFRQIAFISGILVLMNIAVSIAGLIGVSILGGLLLHLDSIFLREFLLKLPAFILYILMAYKMFIRYGYMDSQRKIFNLNLKMLAVIMAIILMLPSAVHNSFLFKSTLINGSVNVNTLLNPGVGTYIIEAYDYFRPNENFNSINAVLIFLSVLITFTLQAVIFWFAYKRGKQIFIRQHIRKTYEYETDENI